jgi:hypothetical protein
MLIILMLKDQELGIIARGLIANATCPSSVLFIDCQKEIYSGAFAVFIFVRTAGSNSGGMI